MAVGQVRLSNGMSLRSCPSKSLNSKCSSYYSRCQDSGNTITASSLSSIFDEEAEEVSKIAGISSDHVQVAKRYMMAQLSQEWPSDFLTSDLYAQLDAKVPKSGL